MKSHKSHVEVKCISIIYITLFWLSFSFCFYNNFDVVLLNKGNVKIIVAFSLLLGTTI